jgi:hypothetical protein
MKASRPPVRLRSALPWVCGVWLLPCQGQEIEPRRWSHLPVGGNFGGVGYAYTTGDIHFDPALRLEEVQFDLQTFAAKYIRSFAVLGTSARVDLTQPCAVGHWSGLVNSVPTEVDREGLGDTSLRFAVAVLGAPPLAGKDFAAYRGSVEQETILGLGLVVQVPSGEYDDDKLINLGGNRFTFRPQLGAVHNWGAWSAELTAAGLFFSENGDFFNGKRLEQDPAFGVDAHLIHTFRRGLWLAGSVGYLGGGVTYVNGDSSKNPQSNFGWGLSVGLPISRTVGVKFAYVGTRTAVGTGLDSDTFATALSVAW